MSELDTGSGSYEEETDFEEMRRYAFREGYTTAVIDMKTANAANGTRRRDKPWKIALKTLATSTAIASQIFMGFVFYNEYFLRRGVTYIEPNLAICGAEFL